MTARELIEQLRMMPADMPVHLAYQYGDYTRTIVSEEVGSVRSHDVVWSDYHRSHRMENDHDTGESLRVVVLRKA